MTRRHKYNAVVIWDRIVTRNDSYVIDLINESAEYILPDKGVYLRDNNITLKFFYYTSPYGGLMRNFQRGVTHFVTPKEYF